MKSKLISDLSRSETENGEIERSLLEFYTGFNKGDIDILRRNWSESSNAIMSNPLGGILKGWDSIESLYERLFKGPLYVHVDFYDIKISDWDQGFLAVGRERGKVSWNESVVELEIRTSRFYIWDEYDKKFNQLHHHGSIESPSMLEDYQSLVNRANQSVTI